MIKNYCNFLKQVLFDEKNIGRKINKPVVKTNS